MLPGSSVTEFSTTGSRLTLASIFNRRALRLMPVFFREWIRLSTRPDSSADTLMEMMRLQPERDLHALTLLNNVKADLPELEQLRKAIESSSYEDGVYRYFHGSLKVYALRRTTLALRRRFKRLMPGFKLSAPYENIVRDAVRQKWNPDRNLEWELHARPIVTAFLFSKYFLDMICLHGRELNEIPEILPSGFAAVLYLYHLR